MAGGVTIDILMVGIEFFEKKKKVFLVQWMVDKWW
jgi:hypothetical protein